MERCARLRSWAQLVPPVLAAALVLGGGAPLRAAAQAPASLHGVVSDEETHQLITSATILLVDEGLQAEAGPDGTFSIEGVLAQPLWVQVSAPGYLTVVQEVFPAADRILFLHVQLRRAEGDATLELFVSDGATGQPLEGAWVEIPELGLTSVTDSAGGAFIVGIPAGQHRLEVHRIGYDPAEVETGFEPGAVAWGEVQLLPDAIEIEGITVVGESALVRLERELARRRNGWPGGVRAMDSEQLRRMAAATAFDLVQRALPRSRDCWYLAYVAFGSEEDGQPGNLCVRARGRTFRGSGITPVAICLDGFRVHHHESELGSLAVEEIALTEFYGAYAEGGPVVRIYTRWWMLSAASGQRGAFAFPWGC